MVRVGLPARLAAILVLATCLGCGPSRPARVAAPPLDPAAVAAAAGDPEALPAAAAARDALDTDKDGRVSRGELQAWLERVRDSKVAVTGLLVRVTHRGKPLGGVEVKLEPEACMAGTTRAAAGRTDPSGACAATIPGGEVPGVNCGLYRVAIVGRGTDGRDLPAKYNADTTLGVAVGARLPESGTITFALD